MTAYAPGSLVRARDREWVVLPESELDLLVLRPLGGGDDDVAAVFPALEPVTGAEFPPPTAADLGDAASAALLRAALRVGFRTSAGPFRSLASLAVEPRSYQFVPLLMALRQRRRAAAHRRRRRHRQDDRGRADRRRTARPGRRPAGSPCCARRR